MALVNQTKYSIGITWGSGNDVKNRTISGFNCAKETGTADDGDMSFIGGFGRSLCQRLSLFSQTSANVASVSKEMPWQIDG